MKKIPFVDIDKNHCVSIGRIFLGIQTNHRDNISFILEKLDKSSLLGGKCFRMICISCTKLHGIEDVLFQKRKCAADFNIFDSRIGRYIKMKYQLIIAYGLFENMNRFKYFRRFQSFNWILEPFGWKGLPFLDKD